MSKRKKVICDVCGDEFTTTPKSLKKRCSKKCQSLAKSKLRNTYAGRKDWKIKLPDFTFGIPEFCSYCGSPAESVDHSIPQSFLRPTRKGFDPCGPMTFCCYWCNSTLGDKYFPTFEARMDYVNSQIVKYSNKHFKRIPSWEDSEIADLDHTLRTYVADKQKKMRQFDKMSVWRETTKWKQIVDQIKFLPYVDKGNDKFHNFINGFFKSLLVK